MNKLSQPKLCDNCEAKLLQTVDDITLDGFTGTNLYCEENKTLGIIHTSDKQLLKWELHGPISQEGTNSKNEEWIYIFLVENIYLYNIKFIKGDLASQTSQLNKLALDSPYRFIISNTYIFNNHLVYGSIIDFEKMIDEILSLYRKDGEWVRLNTAILERLTTIFISTDVRSPIEKALKATEDLRYFADELRKQRGMAEGDSGSP